MSESAWDKHTKHLSGTALKTIARHYTIADLLEIEESMKAATHVSVSESPDRVNFCIDHRKAAEPNAR
jgi:hypothetical protein